MAHDEEIKASSIENPDVAHEESDIKVRPLVWSMVWLAVATAVVFLLMKGMFLYFEGEAKKQDELERPALADERNPIPPKPLLQIGPEKTGLTFTDPSNSSPLSEITALREAEQLKLEHYTWVDQSKGVVGLPIDRAKELLLERGALKSRPPQPAAAPATATEAAKPATGVKPAAASEKPIAATESAKPAAGDKKTGSPKPATSTGAKPTEKKQP